MCSRRRSTTVLDRCTVNNQYLKTGHTFTSAARHDSFRHQVEQSFNRYGEGIWFQWLSICSRTCQFRRNRCRNKATFYSDFQDWPAWSFSWIQIRHVRSHAVYSWHGCVVETAQKAELDISILIFNTRNRTRFPRIDHREHRLNRTALPIDVFLRCPADRTTFCRFYMWCLVLQFWYRPVETIYSSYWIMFTVYFVCVDICVFIM